MFTLGTKILFAIFFPQTGMNVLYSLLVIISATTHLDPLSASAVMALSFKMTATPVQARLNSNRLQVFLCYSDIHIIVCVQLHHQMLMNALMLQWLAQSSVSTTQNVSTHLDLSCAVVFLDTVLSMGQAHVRISCNYFQYSALFSENALLCLFVETICTLQ